MEFNIEKKKKQNSDKFEKTDIDLAYNLAKKAYKEFGNFLKGIVIFGSAAKKKKNKHKKTGKYDFYCSHKTFFTKEIRFFYFFVVFSLFPFFQCHKPYFLYFSYIFQ